MKRAKLQQCEERQVVLAFPRVIWLNSARTFLGIDDASEACARSVFMFVCSDDAESESGAESPVVFIQFPLFFLPRHCLPIRAVRFGIDIAGDK